MHIYENINNKYNIKLSAFFILMLFLLPFDSIPFVKTSYRPISVFISLIMLLSTFYYYTIIKVLRMSSIKYLVIIFYCYSIANSFGNALFLSDYKGFYDFAITISLGLCFFMVLSRWFEYIRLKVPKEYFNIVISLIYPIFYIALFFGLFQLLGSIFGGTLNKVIKEIGFYIAGGFRSRVNWFSQEGSWAVNNMFFFLPILEYKVKKNGILKLIFIITLLGTFSLTGLIYLFLYYIIKLFIHGKMKNRIFKVVLIFACIIVTIVFINILLTTSFKTYRNVERFKDLFETRNIFSLIKYSSSETVRIGFPIAGIREIKENLLLGVGGGNSRYFMKDYFFDIFPWGIDMPEVRKYMYIDNNATPRNMYARIIGENGLIGILILILLMYSIHKKIKVCEIGEKEMYLVKNMLITLFLILLQMDSFVLMQIWVVIGIIDNIPKNAD